MITITVKVDEIDYGALVKKLLPIARGKLSAYDGKLARILTALLAVGGEKAADMINALPQKTKDAVAAALINGGKERISDALQNAAREHDVVVEICGISAETSEDTDK